MKITNFQTIVTDWTPSIPADTYNEGEVMADTEEVVITPNVAVSGMRGAITNISILDKGTTSSEITVVVFDQNISLGTEGSAVSVSDDNLERVVTSWNSTIGNEFNLVNSLYKTGESAYIHEPKYFHSTTGSLWVAVRNGTTGVVRAEDSLHIRIAIMLENIAVA